MVEINGAMVPPLGSLADGGVTQGSPNEIVYKPNRPKDPEGGKKNDLSFTLNSDVSSLLKGDQGVKGGTEVNHNVMIAKVKPCEYLLTYRIWLNVSKSLDNGCDVRSIQSGLANLEEAVRRFWTNVDCECRKKGAGQKKEPPAPVMQAKKKNKKCRFTVKFSWSADGEEAKEGADKKGENERSKQGMPLELYFECRKRKDGEEIGLGRKGVSGFKGFIRILAGDANEDDKDIMVTGSAHELGHNLIEGAWHNTEIDIDKYQKENGGELPENWDIMNAIVPPLSRAIVSNTTKCKVMQTFAKEKMCDECCGGEGWEIAAAGISLPASPGAATVQPGSSVDLPGPSVSTTTRDNLDGVVPRKLSRGVVHWSKDSVWLPSR